MANESSFVLRAYRPDDCAALVTLFRETVHAVCRRDYTQEQLDAWAPSDIDETEWDRSFCAHRTVVAQAGAQIVGFGDIDATGYLDRLYVHRCWQGRGVAAAICDALEQGVRAPKVTTHASITARPFFEHRGYRMVREQRVERRGIWLTNYLMELDR